MKQFQICLFLSKQNYFLKFDLTQDRTRGPTDKVSGLPSEGRRFDSRHCQFWQINFFFCQNLFAPVLKLVRNIQYKSYGWKS